MKQCGMCGARGTAARCAACTRQVQGRRNRLRNTVRPTLACPRCGVVARMTLEHVVPVQAGGSDDPDNLAWLCQACNRP